MASPSITIAVTILFVVLTATPPVRAQPVETRDRGALSVEIASEEIRRYPLLMVAAGRAANRGLDLALDEAFGRPEGKTTPAVLGRLLRLHIVTLPVAAATHFGTHEAGHVVRLHEAGGSVDRLTVTRWPWPVPIMTGRIGRREVSDELKVIVGGAEAGNIQEEYLLDLLYAVPNSDYFDWALLLYSKLDMPLYTWVSRLGSDTPRRFGGVMGDPEAFAEEFRARRAPFRFVPPREGDFELPTDREVNEVYRMLNRGMLLNLADYSLVMGFVRLVDYVGTGQRRAAAPALRIAGVGLVPAARFRLTPLGPERGVQLRVVGRQRQVKADVGAIETASGRHLWAAGGAVRFASHGPWVMHLRADVFQRTGDLLGVDRDGVGVRLEAGTERAVHLGRQPLDLRFRLGYKSRGYLYDAPERSTLLGSISIGVRF